VLDGKAKIDTAKWPLLEFCRLGDVEQVKRLIAANPTCINQRDKYGSDALSWAASSGRVPLVKYLVEEVGMKPHKTKPHTTHTEDADTTHTEDADTTHTEDADTTHTEDADTTHTEDADTTHSKTVTHTKTGGQDRKQQTHTTKQRTTRQQHSRARLGRLPLHWAARHGHVGVVKYLLRTAQADVDGKSNDDTTPLHLACYAGHMELAKLLIDFGADPHAVNTYGCGCAHWVAMGGSVELAGWLNDEVGVSFSQKQREGHTPLHKAVIKGKGSMVNYLVDLLVSSGERSVVGARDACGMTALELAYATGMVTEASSTQETTRELHVVDAGSTRPEAAVKAASSSIDHDAEHMQRIDYAIEKLRKNS